MHHNNQLALGLFPEDRPPPYPETPPAIVVSVSGGLDSDYAALWARQRWPSAPIIVLFPVLVTPQCTDLVATRFTALSSVFFTYNGSASWRSCTGPCTRPVRAS